MLKELRYREQIGEPIQVGLIGAGAMGVGIALQIKKTPGMELSFIADLNQDANLHAQKVYGKSVPLYTNADEALDNSEIPLDVLVESTNSIAAATRYCLKAIQRKSHIVLMNAEVDLVAGFYLQHEANKHGVVVTSDAGDQHGVLMRMIEEIELWGFDIVQAGNIKGFLDRHATSDSKREIAKQLNLNLQQCVAYTDGTKLNIEMALIGNGANLIPYTRGMQGPKAKDVSEALNLFDFDSYKQQGRIDYILGAEPGGGVYVIGKCDDPIQAEYLKYYKVQSKFPYYLFYRPYHLCHLETPRAIALAALWNKALLTPSAGYKNDVYTYAKQHLKSGTAICHAIGGDYTYGLVHETENAISDNLFPIGLFDTESHEEKPKLLRDIAPNEPILWSDIDLPETEILTLYNKQKTLLESVNPNQKINTELKQETL